MSLELFELHRAAAIRATLFLLTFPAQSVLGQMSRKRTGYCMQGILRVAVIEPKPHEMTGSPICLPQSLAQVDGILGASLAT